MSTRPVALGNPFPTARNFAIAPTHVVVPAQIELSAVTKAYGRQVVLDRADLEVSRAEFLVVMGRSGSGKSTLLKLIGGLDTADAGVIRHEGRNLGAMTDAERTLFRRRGVGFVFQFFNLIPTLNVSENVLLPLALNSTAAALADKRVAELLGELGVEHCARRFPEELSGGEQQRVAIARALAHEPALILADEPTGNLDLESARHVLALLSGSCRERGATLIMATHSVEAAEAADRALRIRDGRLEKF